MSDLIEFEAAYEAALRNSVPGTIKDIARLCWQAARAQPAQAGQVLTDDQWQRIADITESFLTRDMKDEIEAVLAKRVPMKREEVKELARKVGYDNATAQERADFINGIRHGERHHGIVGEKGGAT